jgi:hypothetical protein
VKKLGLVPTVFALCSLSFAQTRGAATVDHPQEAALLAQNRAAEAAPHSPFSSAACAFTFASGSNNTFLKYCVTVNGNVTQFQTPAGHEHIAVGKRGEGYGICDTASNVAYDDYAEFGDSGNWDAATVVNETVTSVKIARTTADGRWTLTQTFTQVGGPLPSVRITMTLKNNTNVDRGAIILRYADVDADGSPLNNLDGTANSAFGWNSTSGTGTGAPFGLLLQTIGSPDINFGGGFAQSTFRPPNPCNPVANEAPGPVTATDGSVVMFNGADVVPKSGSITVMVGYRGL